MFEYWGGKSQEGVMCRVNKVWKTLKCQESKENFITIDVEGGEGQFGPGECSLHSA